MLPFPEDKFVTMQQHLQMLEVAESTLPREEMQYRVTHQQEIVELSQSTNRPSR